MPDGSNVIRRRPAPAAQWPLDDGITVVLFAGMGGACKGLEDAGFPVAVANNHDDVALAAHAALHPHTRHVRGDIFDVDPIQATNGRPVKNLWGSPDCTDHSVAKGGAPRSPRVRSLAWQICRWAGKTSPDNIYLENVREIRGWGPMVAKRCRTTGRVMKLDGTVAAPGERVPVQQQHLERDRRKGRLGRSYRRFKLHLTGLGYDYEDRDLRCADYGIPTIRARLFGMARRRGEPISWPEKTHAQRLAAPALGLKPWVSAASIIDWSIPVPSIFTRPRPLVDATCRRIASGMWRYVLNNPKPFIIPVTHGGMRRGFPVDGPLPTITSASGGELALVAPLLIQTGYGERKGQAPRVLDLEAPLGTLVAGGGKHALVAAWMVQHNTGVIGRDCAEPMATATCEGTQRQVGAAYLVHLRGTGVARDATDPIPTLTAGGEHVAIVAAFMQQYYSQGGTSQAMEEPLHTVTTLARHAIVTVVIDGLTYAVADIGMRMLEPEEAARAHGLTLPKLITLGGKTRKLTKREGFRLVGNSVPSEMARLIVQANSPHLLATQHARAA